MSAPTQDYRSRMARGPRGDLQHALFRVLRSLVFRGDPSSAMSELPISQLKCLHIVNDSEGLKMIDIAHRMEIGLPAVSQIVDRLVRKGLVERLPDPQDRRVVRIALTDKARAIVAEAERHRQARMDATLDHVDEASLGGITRSLELLADAAEWVEAADRGLESAVSAAHCQPDPFNGPGSVPKIGDTMAGLIAERERLRRQSPDAGLLPIDSQDRP
jgi:DNA-binding MarR family transcriptional regulator